MKQEHFIYKSDWLYYIKDMPEKEYYETHGHFDRITASKDGMSAYNEAIKRAKAEAVKIVEGELLIAEYIIKQVYDIHEVKDYRKGMKSYLEEGCVYTINMKEKIEVVCEGRCKGIKCTIGKVCDGDSSHNCLDKVARIVVPKKEPDHECIIEVASNLSYHDKPKT